MFSDKGFGLFNGAGALEDIYECQLHEMSPYGATFRVRCDQCGNQQDITIGWQQLADCAHAPKTNRLPIDPETRQPWVMSNGRMHPNIGCINGSCRRPIFIAFTPDECLKLVQQGINGGYIRQA